MTISHPIPESGGRWARDPNTGELTRMPDDETEVEPAAEDTAPRKPAAKADKPLKGA